MGVSVVDTILQADCLRGAQRFPYSLKALDDLLLHNNHLHNISLLVWNLFSLYLLARMTHQQVGLH